MGKVTELVLALKERCELQAELNSQELEEVERYLGAELAMHQRDQHGEFWDYKSDVEHKKALEAKIRELRKKLLENQERMIALEKGLCYPVRPLKKPAVPLPTAASMREPKELPFE